MSFIIVMFIFLFGSAIGSFLNVVICHLETAENGSPPVWRRTVLRGRSHCPKCGVILRWYDLIPLVSFFVLRGQCRDCGEKISQQYPLVEVATGALFLLIFWNLGFEHWDFIGNWKLEIGNLFTAGYMLYVICSLLVIFVYDLRHYIIPDIVLFPAIGAIFLWRGFLSLKIGHWSLIENWSLVIGYLGFYLLVALAAAVFFLAIVLITRGRGMGLGDVKLAFLMGLMLGWPQILVALFLAFLSGASVGLTLIAAGSKTLKSQIPFGPFLVGGTIVSLFFGQPLINFYFRLLF